MSDVGSLLKLFQQTSTAKTRLQQMGEAATLAGAAALTLLSFEKRSIRAAIRYIESLDYLRLNLPKNEHTQIQADQILYQTAQQMRR